MSKRIIDHKNNKFSSISRMCSYWGISKATYNERIKHGWSLKDALTIPIGSKSSRCITIIDHEDNEFPSITAMCRHWGVSRPSYDKRIKYGWSLKDALTIPVGSKSLRCITIIDHEGNKFSSIKAMCKHWGVSRPSYDKRIKYGWSLKDALTIPVGSKSLRCITIIDHEGNEFPTIAAMCKHWNIRETTYDGRIKRGWSLKDALTIPIGSKNSKCITITDHEGNEFPSVEEMCKYWDIPRYVYENRIRAGYSIEKALTAPVNSIYGPKSATDHEGNEFPTIAAMCRHWNITKATYNGRIKRGWSLKDSLTIPIGSKNSKCITIIDHEGNEFPSITAMCRHWNIARVTYNNRIGLGWSQQKTLTTISKNTDICNGYTVLYQIDYCEDKDNEVNCYMCSIKGIDEPIVRDFEDIFNDILQLRETGHIDWIDIIQEGNKKDE